MSDLTFFQALTSPDIKRPKQPACADSSSAAARPGRRPPLLTRSVVLPAAAEAARARMLAPQIHWGKTRSGGWTIKRKTRRARLQRAHKAIWAWCRDHRHWSLPEQHRCLVAKLRGHYAFYGIRGNYKALEVVYEYVETAWKHWLGRRTRNGSIPFETWHRKYRQAFPLPKSRIVHAC
jgi:hypothetical protein